MFLFILEAAVASIIISIVAYKLKLIPHYSKRKHAVLLHVLNYGFLTIAYTLFLLYGVFPSLIFLLALVLFTLLLSIRLTNALVRHGGVPGVDPAEQVIDRGKTPSP
jgi:hypothetical protein